MTGMFATTGLGMSMLFRAADPQCRRLRRKVRYLRLRHAGPNVNDNYIPKLEHAETTEESIDARNAQPHFLQADSEKLKSVGRRYFLLGRSSLPQESVHG